MKKVLFFTHCLVGGGAEKTIINLAEYINKNRLGWEAYIGVVYTDRATEEELTTKVYVLKNATSPEMKKHEKAIVVLKQARELRKLKKELAIDTCVSFLPGADFLNVLSRGKERIVMSVRNKESFFVNSVFRKLYIKYCYAHADKIVAISKRVAYDICHFFGVKEDKVVTIYNPSPDFVVSDNVPEEFEKLIREKEVLITAGRLTEQKGQGYLIKAFSIIHKKCPNTHLLILGKGELENDLKKLVNELNLEQSVSFYGFVRNPYDYIARAEIFVFSSIVEGLGNVLVETLKCGTPIVSADCDCGPREILAPDTDFTYSTDKIEYAQYGVLVPVCKGDYHGEITVEESKMAEAVIELLNNREIIENYVKKSQERVQHFEIGQVVEQWLQVF